MRQRFLPRRQKKKTRSAPDGHLPFDVTEGARDEEGEADIEDGHDHQRFVNQKRVLPDLVGNGIEIHHRDGEGERRRLQLENDLAADRGQGDTDRPRQPDTTKQREGTHAEGAPGFELPFGTASRAPRRTSAS